MEVVWDSIIYARELKTSYLIRFYYFTFEKVYQIEKIIKKPMSGVQYFWKPINLFYKYYFDKPIATPLLINFTLLIVKLKFKPSKAII